MLKFKPTESIQITAHFDTSEFACKCGTCVENSIDSAFVEKLEDVRIQFGKPISVSSGYRCPSHNKDVGGVSGSSHPAGIAADIQPEEKTKENFDTLYNLLYTKFDNIGDGRNKGFIHVDDRPAKPSGKRTWTY